MFLELKTFPPLLKCFEQHVYAVILSQIVNRPHPSFVLTVSVALSQATNSSQQEFMFPS